MRFIFCCFISLGVVYAAILRHDGYLVDPGRLAVAALAAPQQAAKGIAAAAAPHIAARVEAYCRHDAAACLADAAALARPLAEGGAASATSRRRGVFGAGTP